MHSSENLRMRQDCLFNIGPTMQEKFNPVVAVPKDKGWTWMCLLGKTYNVYFNVRLFVSKIMPDVTFCDFGLLLYICNTIRRLKHSEVVLRYRYMYCLDWEVTSVSFELAAIMYKFVAFI